MTGRRITVWAAAALLWVGTAHAEDEAEQVAAPGAEPTAEAAPAEAAPALTAPAQTVQTQAAPTQASPSTWRKLAARAEPDVGLYYSRALAPVRYSDFRHFTGLQLGLGVRLEPLTRVRASLSFDRELGAPISVFRASNTTLSGDRLFDLGKVGWLRPTAYLKLPTHGEDRYYLSYRGSVGAGATLLNQQLYVLRSHHAFGASAGVTLGRNFFAYTTSREGALFNRLYSVGAGASLLYTFREKVSLTLSFRNTLLWTAEGRTNDRYELSGAVSYAAPYGLRFSLATVTSDRTFEHDQQSWNVNLYKPESTQLVFSVAYAPKFDVL